MDGTEYVFPSYFIGDPSKPVGSGQSAIAPRNLLGLTGVVDKLLISFDGKSVSAAGPHGSLIIETQ
jgi:hypothetical protein